MKQDELARKIVANLSRRYRFTRNLASAGAASSVAQLMMDVAENEAWNAYVVRQRILYGQE